MEILVIPLLGQVHRKLTRFDNETKTLIEVFNMADDEKLP